jgi:Asp-tRNA(Asn)/Glu-tRNA(Gln) amidotransferase A subunit family amidase
VDARHAPRRFDLVETTIPAIQDGIEDHVITAEQLMRMYHQRIAAYDEATTATRLNSYIHLNRHALYERPHPSSCPWKEERRNAQPA